MKQLIYGLFLISCLGISAQSLQNLDQENGFRGKAFGKPLSEFKNMLFVTGTGEVKVFTDRSEDLGFGEATLKKITYEFYKEKFYKVDIEIHGKDNREAALKYLQSKYGPGIKMGGIKGQSYRWQGHKVNITYQETPLGATIEIESKEMESRMDRDKDKQQD